MDTQSPTNTSTTLKGIDDVNAHPSRGSIDKKVIVTPIIENDEKATVTTTPGDNDVDVKVSYPHCYCLIVDGKTRMNLLETGLHNTLEKLNNHYEMLL